MLTPRSKVEHRPSESVKPRVKRVDIQLPQPYLLEIPLKVDI